MEINLEDFKSHLQFEEGMDDAMLEFYLDMGKKYAKGQLMMKIRQLPIILHPFLAV